MKPLSKLFLLLGLCLPSLALAEEGSAKEGPFKPTNESLRQYQCPEWFRDAKFGIWSHWGPQCVPERDNWYARHLYLNSVVNKQDGSARQHLTNKFHLEHYGHPSKFGFKDIIPLFKGEKWEPERLMELYKKAGAKYFVSMGVHHDNFALYASKLTRWNSVAIGPKQDIVGRWQQEARKQGLRFGISEHLAASWWFYSSSKGADKTGPMAGIPYDGADPQYADLYWSGNENPSFDYYGEDVPEAHKRVWGERVQEIIDLYHPDLLYSDSPLPYADVAGRKMLAHYYNNNLRQNGGKLDAVYNCKQPAEGRWVRDLERGVMDGINPEPWQTDTCVGEWFYQKGVKYKSSTTVIHMLIDIVSKNGNLLLNFPQHADGTLDPEAEQMLADLAVWMPINAEGIYATRPWKVYGEGPSKADKSGHFNERNLSYTARDFRFTSSKDGQSLYGFCLGMPGEELRIASLGANLTLAEKPVAEVEMLGSPVKLQWKQEPEALVIKTPAGLAPSPAVGFKIRFAQ